MSDVPGIDAELFAEIEAIELDPEMRQALTEQIRPMSRNLGGIILTDLQNDDPFLIELMYPNANGRSVNDVRTLEGFVAERKSGLLHVELDNHPFRNLGGEDINMGSLVMGLVRPGFLAHEQFAVVDRTGRNFDPDAGRPEQLGATYGRMLVNNIHILAL
jgi:hypothetical protein